jgi:hypothetical protein
MKPAVFSRAWTLPKDGNTTEQNEDAWRLASFVQGAWRQGIQLTLADGTTEAVYSGLWARTLAAAAEPDWPALGPGEWEERLDEVKKSFTPFDRDGSVPWYVRNKYLTQGSQATLLTATLSQEPGLPGRMLRALAVGDCCLFLLRPRAQIFAFPLIESEQFGQNPALIISRPQRLLSVQRCEALVQPGDLLLACSDALARWILQIAEVNEFDRVFDVLTDLLAIEQANLWNGSSSGPEWRGWKHWLKSMRSWIRSDVDEFDMPVESLTSADEFQEFVDRMRGSENLPRMRNDDTTLILCLPLEPLAGNKSQSTLDTIAELRDQFASATVSVRPLQDAGIPESSRRWLLPWNLDEAVT